MKKNIFTLVFVFLFSVLVVSSVNAADIKNEWADYINSGKVFYVAFDTTSFDDSGWTGASDPMGTLKGGETYTVQYNSSTTNWSVTGLNEGSGTVGTFGYKTISPKDGKLNLWGRVYSFDASGAVIDGTYGVVGHLSKTAKPSTKFPVTELGSCKSEAECQSFCAKQENMLACVSYGEKSGLLTKEQADQSKKFADVLKGEGPGACKDQASCENFCSDLKNIDSCLTFAEKHDLIPAGALKEAKQVASALKAGATMPGGCKDKDSCSTYCSVSTHAEECLGFAEKAGFVSAEDAVLARKVLPLINSGQSPGGCKTKADCQSYCDKDGNTTECLNFAEKAGLISAEDVTMAKKVGGKGPGGCSSKDSCEAFCNNSANQESCFQFAKEHDIIPADKLKMIQDGLVQMKAGLEQASPEVLSCLKNSLGENIISQVENGTFMPGPAQGGMIQKCFESMKVEGMKKFQQGLGQMPPEARSCLEQKLGKDKVAAIENGENVDVGPEIGTAMQSCASVLKDSAIKMMDEQLSKAPPEIRDCIKGKINDDIMAKIQSGAAGSEVIVSLISACMANFKPNIPTDFKPSNIPEGFKPSDIPTGGNFKIPSTGSFGPSGGAVPAGIPVNIPVNIPTSVVPASVIPTIDCKNFAMVPSCSYVPEAVQGMCKKCKGE